MERISCLAISRIFIQDSMMGLRRYRWINNKPTQSTETILDVCFGVLALPRELLGFGSTG
jgi:hypothetical protein